MRGITGGTIRSPRQRTRLPWVGAASTTCVLVGCTAFSDFGVRVCSSDADCRTPAQVAVCVESRCVAGCATNQQCSDFDPRQPICQYPGGDCVGLLSEGPECYANTNYDEAQMGGSTARDMVLLGAFAESITTSFWLTAQLAADEINDAGGVPGPHGSRPLVAVLCDDSLQAEAIAHLVVQLEVSAVVASLDDAALRDVLAQPDVGDRAFFLSPAGSATRPASFGDRANLLWYLGAEYSDVVAAYGGLASGLTSSVAGRGDSMSALRLASISGAAAEDSALSRDVARLLNKSGVDTSGSDSRGPYRTFDLFGESPLGPADELRALIEYEPAAVFFFAGGNFDVPVGAFDAPLRQRASVLRSIDASTTVSPQFHPTYVLGPRNLSASAAKKLAVDSVQFRSNALTLRAGRLRDEAVARAVALRFNEKFPNVNPLGTGLSVDDDAYDAVYLLAYAVGAVPFRSGRAMGRDVYEGFARVTDASAERVDIGPGIGAFERAAELLQAKAPFNLHGTSGPADFEPTEHARPGPTHAYCWDAQGEAREGAVFDSANGIFEQTSNACSTVLSYGVGQ
jgi:hypothetical protein